MSTQKQRTLWLVGGAVLVLLAGSILTIAGLDGFPMKSKRPPLGKKLEMSGDIGDFIPGERDDPVHDPTLFRHDGTYYVFSTGILRQPPHQPGGIYARYSAGSLAGPWQSLGEIAVPEWTRDYNIQHVWAPHVAKKEDTYYLYYAVSSFGTNRSAIGVMQSQNPGDLNSWMDLGPVITSDPGVSYNAIDPMVFEDEGKWWIVFGSHFGGIYLQQLEDMKTPTGELYRIAARSGINAIEAPTIIKKDRYYYLFTSWDACCRGVDSTYKIAVGRAEQVTGPYRDRNGKSLTAGGGEILLESEGNQIGPGGQDVYEENGVYYLIHHYYDALKNGVIRMQIRVLDWDEEGWPVFHN